MMKVGRRKTGVLDGYWSREEEAIDNVSELLGPNGFFEKRGGTGDQRGLAHGVAAAQSRNRHNGAARFPLPKGG